MTDGAGEIRRRDNILAVDSTDDVADLEPGTAIDLAVRPVTADELT